MIGSRLILPGTVNNPALPDYTENATYDAIASLPGLFHYLDYSVVLATNPLSVQELARDIGYYRRSGFAGNPSIATVNGEDVVNFTAANSEMETGENINFAGDFSIVMFLERDASSSTGSTQTLFAFSVDSGENGQFYLNTGTSILIPYSSTSGKAWGAGVTFSLTPGEKAVMTLAYDSTTRTLRVYKNGVAAGSSVKGAAMIAAKLYFGRNHLFRLGDVFVFDTDLSDTAHQATKEYAENFLIDKFAV